MRNYVLSILTFIIVLFIFVFSLESIYEKSVLEGRDTLQNAIKRSSIQCYAIEGRYPASIDYLKEHYGLQVDDDKYVVFYEGFASNVMPEITVTRR